MFEKLQIYKKGIEAAGFSDTVYDYLTQCGYKTIGQFAYSYQNEFLQSCTLDDVYKNEIIIKMKGLGIFDINMADDNELFKGDAPNALPYPKNLYFAYKKYHDQINDEDLEKLKNEEFGKDRIKGINAALIGLPEKSQTIF